MSAVMDQCENCGTSGLESFIDRPAHVLKRCPGCQLYQKGTLETQMIYEDEYHDCYSVRLKEKIKTAKIRLGAAKHYLESNQGSQIRSLDIGCSVGAAVSAAREFGWSASGVDVSQTAIEFCKNQDLDCHRIAGVALPFEDGTFDLVTHWHVIEHVDDVLESLAEWKRVLKPGGVMMFETPNSDYIKAKIMGPRYEKFWPSEHLYTFNRKNCASLLTKSGFEILPTRLTGGAGALPLRLNSYAMIYRGFREFSRKARICKSFEMTCRKPIGNSLGDLQHVA
ncbi:MAG: methyltransferase domain-containing protein [Mariniblastus sp.]